MRILIICESFHPSFGGPPVSTTRLGRELSCLGHSIGFWAPDGSAVASQLTGETKDAEKFSGSCRDVLGAFRPSIIHDNGIWALFHHRVARLAKQLSIPRVVSTRGMLEPWALQQRNFRKFLAMRVYQKADLQSATALHATSHFEVESIKKVIGSASIFTIPNGVDIPTLSRRTSSSDPHCTEVLFVGRIHPKKGLGLLIDAVAKLKSAAIKVTIAGPDSEGYQNALKRRAREMGVFSLFEFVGPKYGFEKTKLFEKSDLFVLPTYSENFGLVVAEALAHGVPVITTTGTPWGELVDHRCGWWVPPDVDSIHQALDEAVGISKANLRDIGLRGRSLVSGHYDWGSIGKRFQDSYAEVQAGSVF